MHFVKKVLVAVVGLAVSVSLGTPPGARALRYDPLRVYRVRGVFEAGPVADKAYGVSFFRLRSARVEEAVGARIFKLGDAPPTGR